MFSLGNKLRVLNTNADVTVTDAAGAAVATSAAVALTDTIHVDGFGDFKVSDIIDMKMHRYVAPVAESKDYTVVAPAGIAIGEAVEVRIYAKTSRYQAELKNNFIGASKPLVFMTAPLTAVTAAAIRTAIVTAWSDRLLQFHNEAPALSVTNEGK